MSSKKEVDRGGAKRLPLNEEKMGGGTGSNCDRNRNRTKSAQSGRESRREMYLMELLRDGLFSLWCISVARETL